MVTTIDYPRRPFSIGWCIGRLGVLRPSRQVEDVGMRGARFIVMAGVLVLGACSSAQESPPPGSPSTSAAESVDASQPAGPWPLSPIDAPGTIVLAMDFTTDGAANLDLLNPRTLELQALTHLTTADPYTRYESPDWMPDGATIVFDIEGPGGSHVYSMHADGSGIVQLTQGEAEDKEPAVAPDGSSIVFRSGEPSALYSMHPDGSQVERLTTPPPVSGGDVSPSFSPDGSQLLFIRGGALEIMNRDGSNLHEIVPASAQAIRARWSPDGSQIVFGNEGEGNARKLHVVNSDGTELRTLPLLVAAEAPAWSPDGQWIVFSWWQVSTGNHGLAAIKPDGTDLRVLWKGQLGGTEFAAESAWTSAR